MAESPRPKRNSRDDGSNLKGGDIASNFDAEAGDELQADSKNDHELRRTVSHDDNGAGKRAVDGEDPTLELERAKEKTKPGDAKKPTVSMLQLFQFADSPDVILIVVGTLAALANGASQPLMTVLFGQIINAFGNNAADTDRLIRAVNTVSLRFVYLSIGSGLAAYFESACWMVSAERQASRIRTQYLRAVLRQDITFFDTKTSTGEIMARLSGDTVLLQRALGDKAGKLFNFTAAFVGGFIVAFTRSWKLTLVMMSAMPLVVVAGGIMGNFMAKMTSTAQNAYAAAGTLVEQVIGSIRTVAAYTGEKKAVEDYNKTLGGAQRAGILQGLTIGGGMGILLFIIFASYGLALWYGATLVLNDGFSGGQVITVLFAVLTGAMGLSQVGPSMSAIANGQAAAASIFEVIKRTPIIDIDQAGLVPEKFAGNVELRHIRFMYPSRLEVPIFEDFSLVIPAGKTVALVGGSGSGKSTVVNLIERFYDPQEGEVLLDGVDIKTIQLKWLRAQIGLVSQEPVLFSTSIKENIRYGNEAATMEEVEQAARFANAAKFISNVPQGYDTLVGERGIQLSGGQKQRVAIARAILKNPRVLLLDEATSALDAQSERVVQDALDRIMTNRTTVVIAHRLTTIRNADMIAVVDHGAIVETGTHSELIQRPDGPYSQLIRLQKYDKPIDDQAADPAAVSLDPDYIKTSAFDAEASPKEVKDSSSVSFARKSLERKSLERSPKKSFGSSRTTGEGGRKSSSNVGDERDGVMVPVEDSEAGRQQKKDTKVSILRLAKLNKPEWPFFVLGSLAASGTGLVFPIFALLLSSVISAFFKPPHQLRKDVNFWAIMFVVLGVGCLITTSITESMFAFVGQKLIRRVRRLTFEKVVQQEIAWFDQPENSSGAISSRLSSDAAAVRSLVGDALSLVIQNIATITAGLAIAFTGNWQLTLVMLAVVPLMGVAGFAQVKSMTESGDEIKEKYEDAGKVANDAVSSVRTVQSFVAEEKLSGHYNDACKGPLRIGIKQGLIGGTALGFGNLFMYNALALCFWVGGKLVQNGTTSFQGVFKVFFAISLSATAISQTAGMSPDFAKVKVSVKSIFGMLDRKSRIDPSSTSGETLQRVNGDVELRRVSFFYPTRPDVQVFHNLSFTVRAGETLALVGESGSGKSTVVSLLERFYDPQSGEILLDGVEIRKLQIRWLRQQMGLVSQEPVLFDQNVDWNIVYGKEGGVSQAEIKEAAVAANAHRFISALPEGYKTRVGERGIQLSGGQKQRVAIARAILRNPKVLLLDEATSALDAESEHVVQEALDRIMVSRTTIVIAHRLSTVRNADIIAVVKNGGIVEKGRHDELIARNGAYASLVKLQAS